MEFLVYALHAHFVGAHVALDDPGRKIMANVAWTADQRQWILKQLRVFAAFSLRELRLVKVESVKGSGKVRIEVGYKRNCADLIKLSGSLRVP